jgi:hypothetical protein
VRPQLVHDPVVVPPSGTHEVLQSLPPNALQVGDRLHRLAPQRADQALQVELAQLVLLAPDQVSLVPGAERAQALQAPHESLGPHHAVFQQDALGGRHGGLLLPPLRQTLARPDGESGQ